MARLPRLGVGGWPHLLLQRVHDRQSLARDDEDRAHCLNVLREAARTHRVAVHAYALADDHLTLLATPETDEGLSLTMQALGRRYVAGFNRRHGREGGLWSGRYRAALLEPAQYLLDAMVFVELEAVMAGSVASVDANQWSSGPAHLGRRTDPLLTDHALFWALGNTPFEREHAWRQRLAEGLPAARAEALRQAMHKSWALLPAQDAARLSALAGRPMAARARGRPRKTVGAESSE